MNEDKATRYHRLKRRASVASLAWSAGFLVALLLSGGSVVIRDLASLAVARIATPAWHSPPVVVLLYVTLLAVLHETVSLPIDFYRGFLLERRYGLATEQPRHWLHDHAKLSLLGFVFGVLGAVFVYATLWLVPGWWWIVSAAAFSLVAIALTTLAPVVLLPLFYHSTPLDREPLRARLVSLAARAGTPVVDAYEWRLSDRTRKANAALTGLGSTRRILVSDTLLAGYSDDEIEVILAHELAHHVHRDIWKGIAYETILTVAGFFIASRLLVLAVPALGLTGAADVAGLPILLLGAMLMSLVILPAANVLSRTYERRADRFALDLVRNPAAFTAAMRRLAAQNLAEERPSRLARWLFYSHPPIEERIGMAERWTAAGTPNRV
ncbi:MAG: M48 family metallopeptidase [Acidobacteria bacterium]|nr:M48 family metallopeptidase [Acidobacteriota bacterium]